MATALLAQINVYTSHTPTEADVCSHPAQSEPEFVTFEIVPGLCEGSIKHRKV